MDEATENKSGNLVERWRGGDQEAAQELYQRYAERLIALVRHRLSPQLAGRVDPEDVVQSVCRSFFTGARNGRFVLQQSGDLWRLLAAITVRKVANQVRHHKADRRTIHKEEKLPNEGEPAAVPDATGQRRLGGRLLAKEIGQGKTHSAQAADAEEIAP